MKAGYFLSAAGLSAILITAAAPASAADDKLEQLKAQGFALIAIANEPPFTAVGADGKVSG
ncbi:ectoine/hydroxyectoine ABC transporter substrate-binding protein EhuB, partial [Rhizobium ruizarguesonis]